MQADIEPVPMWPSFRPDEVDAAIRVLESGKVNYWTGSEGRAFEEEFAEYCGVPHAVAVANGTVALELALHALGVGEGDEVVVTPRTFIASASAAVLQGARPVFADVDPDSQNITAETVEAVLSPRTRAIICVHLAGWPCAMDGIMALAEENDLLVIEDCAQAHGATYRGQPVGSFGHAAAFSFCQDKIMTTGGEGGMALFRDEDAWKCAWAHKDHGKSYDTVYHEEHPPGFRWLHESFGTNGRMTEMQSAIGRIQLRKLPGWLDQRRRNAAVLRDAFRSLPGLRVPEVPDHVGHAFYKFYAFVEESNLPDGWGRDRILFALQERGIPVRSGSCSEIYREKAFDGTGFRPTERLLVARRLGETSLMFQVHPTMKEEHMRRVAEEVRAVMAPVVYVA